MDGTWVWASKECPARRMRGVCHMALLALVAVSMAQRGQTLGRRLLDDAEDVPCPVGYYEPDDGLEPGCLPCDPGTYQDVPGQTECIPCDDGDFQPQPGQDSCDYCEGESISATECLESCGPGTTGFDPNCATCSAGWVSTGGDQPCTACAVGSTPNDDGSDCEPCPDGYTTPAEGSEYCEPIPCPSGTYNFDTGGMQPNCVPCEAGYTTDGASGQATCTACPVGTFKVADGDGDCVPCDPAYTTSTEGSTTCDVPASCPAGQYRVPGEATCADCPAGSVSESAGADSCTLCAVGTFAPTAGLTACQDCDPGTTTQGEGASSCSVSSSLPCDAGTFNADTGAAPCSACPAGTYQDGSTPTVCLLCGANQVQPAPGQSSCEDCPTGTASADGITCSFPACDPGSYSATGTGPNCVNCAAGFYADQPGATECSACPAETFQALPGQAYCDLCAPGSSTNGWDGQSNCFAAEVSPPCEPGTVSNTGNSPDCQPCTADTYQAESGQTACFPCPSGQTTAGLVGQTQCLEYAPNPCLPGTFNVATGGLEPGCQLCTPGTYQDLPAGMTESGIESGRTILELKRRIRAPSGFERPTKLQRPPWPPPPAGPG
ncbi:hypothetical protein CHLRE_12g488351v5 [Chlamydomonas reinhardtii]|uniref:Tyrosine-protein kinase ephrin type A/B receptor-like domain-containing protein n=1 Tax=Chlamydomonas reinhardtii TaxID=3055 RepID=A0A2K3D288_CHLRE|nr:uncharacterized protein CHLRE_12g488351v5 [Chlamydomonas reinhardtii]PNW74656.1 hypothetical protein CHLRE_12g488351v5 [Chlamydomonas reinhardtii]